MTDDKETLAELSQEYQDTIPADLRTTRTFDWYLDQLYEDPKIARSAHQRVADMFDYYGTEYDEEAGVVEYELASEDPLDDGENTFYGRVVHEAMEDMRRQVEIMIQESDIEYLQPIYENISVVCEPPDEDAVDRFQDMLDRWGRARLELECTIHAAGERAATFMGRYVALAKGEASGDGMPEGTTLDE